MKDLIQKLLSKPTTIRSRRYRKNVLFSLVFQALSIGTSLILVPITLLYLGVTEYGIWITLTNIVAWLAFFDIGLGHGLRNRYAEANAQGNQEEMKKFVSTAFFLLGGISISIFVLFTSIHFFIDWARVLNAPSYLSDEIASIAFFLIVTFCLRFVVSIVNNLLTADQEPSVPVFLNAMGNLLSLITVFIVTITTEGSLLYIAIALSISQLLPLVGAFFYLFGTRYKMVKPSFQYFSKEHINSIFGLGAKFFVIQLTALILFQSNNIIIAHTVGLDEVSSFNIGFKYINILYLGFTAFLTPLWSASTEAFVKGDIDWIKASVNKLNTLWLGLVIAGFTLVAVSPLVYKVWLKGTLEPDFLLLTLLCLYFVFLCRDTIYRSFMNGTGKISLQLYVTIFQSILHIPFAIIAGKTYGVKGVVMVMLLWVVINSIWEKIQFQNIINNKARGIWNR